uniref:Uncharacterized protein n=1 Tax=Candidozyma auris TaxID=498019 RepID=A0A0L0P2I6_CANAR
MTFTKHKDRLRKYIFAARLGLKNKKKKKKKKKRATTVGAIRKKKWLQSDSWGESCQCRPGSWAVLDTCFLPMGVLLFALSSHEVNLKKKKKLSKNKPEPEVHVGPADKKKGYFRFWFFAFQFHLSIVVICSGGFAVGVSLWGKGPGQGKWTDGWSDVCARSEKKK